MLPWEAGATVAVASGDMARVHNVARFLGAERVLPLRRLGRAPDGVSGAAGWGSSPSSLRARSWAAARRLPFLHAEDGFFRSVGLGKAGAPPISLVLDGGRPFYDGRGPSDLEAIVAARESADPVFRETALKLRLSKYNHEPDALPASLAAGRPYVLLVDQVAGDRSIAGAGATAASFAALARRLRDERPGARIVLRAHPDVVAGLAHGVLYGSCDAEGFEVCAEPASPRALLGRAEEVWTVSSQLGFEALLGGVPVVCGATPFYAGWGLTRDLDLLPDARARRVAGASADRLAHAALQDYSRWVDPVTGRPMDALEGMERLARWRDDVAGRSSRYVCVGFRRWKRPMARAFLSRPGNAVEFAGPDEAAAMPSDGRRVVVWGYSAGREHEAKLRRAHGPLLRMEDGFVRSVGLGSDFVPPSSVVLAEGNLHFDASGPNAFDAIVANAAFDDALVARAAALRARLVAENRSKYNLGAPDRDPFSAAEGREKVLVVGQVEDDAAVRLGGGIEGGNAGLLRAVRAMRPDAFIVFKEHPDVASGNRKGALRDCRDADAVVRDGDASFLVSRCDAVHVVSSLTGFEALLRGSEVVAHGSPFYAGWGLTKDLAPIPWRKRLLSLDELVAAALILYPLYADSRTGVPCGPEDMLDRMASGEPVPGPVRRSAGRILKRAARWTLAQLRAA